jgi:polyisoprenoid-binding protein YceI
MMRGGRIAAVAAAFAACAAFAQAPAKLIAAKSTIRFTTRQMNVPVEGAFRRFDATVAFDPQKPGATKAQFEVDLASIDLGNAEGEAEAKGKSWLDVPAFPKATFVASSVRRTGAATFEATGQLTIKGATRTIVAPFTYSESSGQRLVDGQFTLKRLQFRIGEGPWADTDTVADDILVKFRFALPSNP